MTENDIKTLKENFDEDMIKELDMEIKKTEEFLKQLKRLKDKLD